MRPVADTLVSFSSVSENPPFVFGGNGYNDPVSDTFTTILFVFPAVLFSFLFRIIKRIFILQAVSVGAGGTADDNIHD
jgi:hypothetical protein